LLLNRQTRLSFHITLVEREPDTKRDSSHQECERHLLLRR